jgi:diguanylate cyclase (GGDEF)-like protein
LAQAERYRWPLAVMFMDLDDFKSINDTHGHQAGDSILRTIGARLTENTRKDDTVSRIGGDEFLFLLMQIKNRQDVTKIARKIITAVEAPCDVGLRDYSISVSVKASIGIAIFPKDGTSPDTLIKSADKALYRAKRDKSK